MPSSESEVSLAVSRQQYWASRLKLLKVNQVTVGGVVVVVGVVVGGRW
jgi:hypothetical protein